MGVFVVAFALLARIEFDLTSLLHGHRTVLSPVCGITVVGYHISGEAGQRFAYDGEACVIPAEGFIELVANRSQTTYRFEGRDIPLRGPLNGFGFMEIRLPATQMKGDSK